MRITWQLKAILPLAGVLFAGVLVFVGVTLSFQHSSQREAVLVVAAAGAVVICASMLVILAVVVQRPLLELQEKIQRVRHGDLTVTVDFSSRTDDVGDLGRDFNAMVRRLRESREEIERLHRTQMSRAEHLATLGELAAGLAHEIRNPLAGVAGVLEVLENDLPPSSRAREVLPEVRQELENIKRYVSDLLEIARPRPPEMRPADLRATVEHAVQMAAQQAHPRNIRLEFEPPPESAQIEHDTTQIHQVLLNLLLNAIQSIESEGEVGVKLAMSDGLAEITVADDGGGISPSDLEQIFRPFFTTRTKGTGLGLSLSQRIVESHGGRIEVQSVVGQGSRFTVKLPVRQSGAVPQPKAMVAGHKS